MKTNSRTLLCRFENYEAHLSFSNHLRLINTATNEMEYPRMDGEVAIFPKWLTVPPEMKKVVEDHFRKKRALRAQFNSRFQRVSNYEFEGNPYLDGALMGVVHYVKNWEECSPARPSL